MEQNTDETTGTQQTKAQGHKLTFRDHVTMSIVFLCIPALVFNVLFWAVATAFPQAGVLPTMMSLLITLLLSLIGGVLIVRYVDICMINTRKFSSSLLTDAEGAMYHVIGNGAICFFLAVCIVGSLSTAGTLTPWQYILMPAEVLLVGYQAWHTFNRVNKQQLTAESGDDPATQPSTNWQILKEATPMATSEERRDTRLFQATKAALKDIHERALQLPVEQRYAAAYGILAGYVEQLLVNFAKAFSEKQLAEIKIVLDQLAKLTGTDEYLDEETKKEVDQLAQALRESEE